MYIPALVLNNQIILRGSYQHHIKKQEGSLLPIFRSAPITAKCQLKKSRKKSQQCFLTSTVSWQGACTAWTFLTSITGKSLKSQSVFLGWIFIMLKTIYCYCLLIFSPQLAISRNSFIWGSKPGSLANKAQKMWLLRSLLGFW